MDPRLSAAIARRCGERVLETSFLAVFDRLSDRLDTIVGPPEPPSRLHGDLWSGNLHTDEQGIPCLIDPAVYGGF